MEGMGMTESWSGRRVLVTGATGIVGSWLTRRLIEMNAQVVALNRDWARESITRPCIVPRLYSGSDGSTSATAFRSGVRSAGSSPCARTASVSVRSVQVHAAAGACAIGR